MTKSTVVFALALGCAAISGVAVSKARASKPIQIQIHACIDDVDDLSLQGRSAAWHVDSGTPVGGVLAGWNDCRTTPTNTTITEWDSFGQRAVSWSPKYGQGGDSLVFDGLPVRIPHERMNIRMRKLMGRGSVTWIEMPTAKNNYTIKFRISDPQIAADWYTIQLNITYPRH